MRPPFGLDVPSGCASFSPGPGALSSEVWLLSAGLWEHVADGGAPAPHQLEGRPAGLVSTVAGGAQLLLVSQVLLALLEEMGFKQEVQVKGQEGQGLQQEEELLKQRLTWTVCQREEAPGVVVSADDI